MPARDSRVRLRKTAPPGMKICDWVGRSAPLDSIRWTRGSRLRSGISLARRVLRGPGGFREPGRVGGPAARGRGAGRDHALGPGYRPDTGDAAGPDGEVGPPGG